VPPLVVREVSPKLLMKGNAPSPPTVFFTTWMEPGTVMALVSNVIAPFRARTRPVTVAPVVSVIDVSARMFPRKTE
jgi:hypothetical protein